MSNNSYTPRGVDRKDELAANRGRADLRRPVDRFRDWTVSHNGGWIVFIVVIGAMWVVPVLMVPLFIVGMGFTLWLGRQHFVLPLRMPKSCGAMDFNDPMPGGGAKSRKAEGVVFLGNERGSNDELWVTARDASTHFLIFGTTGSGKSEALLSLSYNSLIHGSGLIYVDGKGDNSLFAKIFSMTRALGREDDLLLINYMTGGREVVGRQSDKLSNNLNPFASGTAGSLTQLLTSLMPESGGDNAMWQGRAVAFISAVMMALCHLRDAGLLQLGVGEIRESLTLDKVMALAKRTDLDARILESLNSYLRSLAGYTENSPDGRQSETTNEQHGFILMQFTRVLSSLADDYGYIFKTTRGEVDFLDVVLNNRVLVVLLPALEKSPEELANLGKIIVASLKTIMASGLGDRVEGETEVIVEAKPTASPSPFLCILDEYGSYVVKGAAMMPAQARSLNFSMVFAGQDYPSFRKNNNEGEAASTVSNCNVLVFMGIQDVDTVRLFTDTVGEVQTARAGAYSREGGGGYFEDPRANISKEARGHIIDVREQQMGEAHIVFKQALVRARMFYAAPEVAKSIRLNHFLRVEPPLPSEMAMLDREIERFRDTLRNDAMMDQMASEQRLRANLGIAVEAMKVAREDGLGTTEVTIAGLMGSHLLPRLRVNGFAKAARAMSLADGGEGALLEEDGGFDVFTDPDDVDEDGSNGWIAGEAGLGALSRTRSPQPTQRVGLDKNALLDDLVEVETADGTDMSTAAAIAAMTIEQMATATHYPNPGQVPPPINEAECDDLLSDLQEHLGGGEGGVQEW